jgi:DNA-binding transcriptional LysR family regulator
MDFKQIEAFVYVARLKSFSKAATAIYLSQPTISSHISALEKELKVQLFDRNSKEVSLTPAGKCFMDYAVDIINTRNMAISTLSDFDKHIHGNLNLEASTTPCNTIVPELIKTFNSLYPEIKFNILEKSSGEIIEDIINLDCEIGIVGSTVENHKIRSYRLMEDHLVIVSAPEFNLPEKITIKELRTYKFIMREKNSATRKTLETALNSVSDELLDSNICCEVNNLDTAIQLVKAGVGISIVSRSVIKNYITHGNLNLSVIEDLDLRRNIHLVVNSKRTLTPTAIAFLNLCKSQFTINNNSHNDAESSYI